MMSNVATRRSEIELRISALQRHRARSDKTAQARMAISGALAKPSRFERSIRESLQRCRAPSGLERRIGPLQRSRAGPSNVPSAPAQPSRLDRAAISSAPANSIAQAQPACLSNDFHSPSEAEQSFQAPQRSRPGSNCHSELPCGSELAGTKISGAQKLECSR